MALTANLPDGVIGHIVDRNLLLIALTATVIISLFYYLKLMLFITVSVLAIGANLPDQLANQIGVSQSAMIVASGVLVLMALLYKFFYSGHSEAISINNEVADDSSYDTINSRNDVITAILNGNFPSLHQLLISDVEINFSQYGAIPLFLAIEKGYADMVLLLLSHGAKQRVKNKDGKTPIEFALEHNNVRIAELIHYASMKDLAVERKSVNPIRLNSKAAVMFADICGSTSLYDKFGNEVALQIITNTLNILILEVAKHKGTLIKTIGDEIMCSFPRIDLAIQAASAMQFAIDAQKPGGDYPINVRIGFHFGEVIHKANDLFGDTVNVAARVAAITRARQIMTTQAVIDYLPPAFAGKVRPIMRAEIRGKPDPFSLFQIIWEPDNSILGRIGQPSNRKPENEVSELLLGNVNPPNYQT